jgi:gas vesicle protein
MTTLDDTMKNAQKLMEETKDNAGHAATKARSTMLDGIHAVATTITMLRGLGVGDALRWVGLQRRQSRAVPLFTFGAGFLAGAAAGILFTPMAGADVRRMLAARAMGVERDVEKAGADAKARVGEKTDELAGKAKDALHGVEGKAKDAFQGMESKAKDAVHKAEEAVNAGASNVKDAIKSATGGDNDPHGVNGNGGKRPDDGTASRGKPLAGGHQSS